MSNLAGAQGHREILRVPNFVPLPFAGALLRGLQVNPTGLGREMQNFSLK